MKRSPAILAVAAAISGLTACGDSGGGNAAVDHNDVQSAGGNMLSNDATDIVTPAPVENGDAPVPAEPQPADDRSSEADEPRRPPPAAPPLAPEPDPHAGHDMNNMADMSHD